MPWIYLEEQTFVLSASNPWCLSNARRAFGSLGWSVKDHLFLFSSENICVVFRLHVFASSILLQWPLSCSRILLEWSALNLLKPWSELFSRCSAHQRGHRVHLRLLPVQASRGPREEGLHLQPALQPGAQQAGCSHGRQEGSEQSENFDHSRKA